MFHRSGGFAGWPANGGIWRWEDEILVGFHAGYYKKMGTGSAGDSGQKRDARAEDGVAPGDAPEQDRTRPQEDLFARSRDGGVTWVIEDPAAKGAVLTLELPKGGSLAQLTRVLKPSPGGINFAHPDFAFAMRHVQESEIGPSFFSFSYDRGHTWSGPFRLPEFGTAGLLTRTSYLVESRDRCLIFPTAAKPNRSNGLSLAARTDDGGKTWQYVSWIVPDLMPDAGIFAIMPSVVRLGRDELYAVVRRRHGERWWISGHRSLDDGRTWREEGTVVQTQGGNPGCLVDLGQGRLAVTYGVRSLPSYIGAKLSRDGGRTWDPERKLRGDGSLRNIGYTQSVRRRDGKVVTVYYFADAAHPEQHIAATIWEPGLEH